MKTVKLKESSSMAATNALADAITKSWLVGLRKTNPAILDMFAERDVLPYRDLLPWSGEFAGKYITGAYFIYRTTLDKTLYDYILGFLDELLSYQDTDGYLGCYSKNCHLTGAFSQTPEVVGGTWDAWSHYHIMYGLLLWYGETGDARYLDAVERAAGLFLRLFYCDGGKKLSEIGSTEMNLSPIHVFALLYEITGKLEYLAFAKNIEEDFQSPNAGNYVKYALNGIEFYQCPKPRWESLHSVIGVAELFRATGEQYYLDASSFFFRSILKTDVHNTGAFSTNEQAVGNPFQNGNVETCCVIAYNALAAEIFQLTGDTGIADFLELSHYNACFGMWSPSGRWSTYDTPMNGDRKANFHQINFQGRPGSPELNCCSVNAARSIGNVSEWRFTRDDDNTFCINLWEAGDYVTEDGVRISISGQYPADGTIFCTVSGYQGTLALRIPGWSRYSTVTANGETYPAESGYYRIPCDGTLAFSLDFDFSDRYVTGEGDQAGCCCFYRGPVLFGLDTAGNRRGDLNAAVLSKKEIDVAPTAVNNHTLSVTLADGTNLMDFAHLGYTGGQYRTWLNITE